MIVRCQALYDGDKRETCGRLFDDAEQWTICPHGPLWADPRAYCRDHDLVDCPNHAGC